MRRTSFIIASVVILLSVVGVRSEEKKEEMTQEEFVQLYVELSRAAEAYLSDSARLVEVQDSIFDSFGFTRDDFEAFKEKVDKHPEKWEKVWKAILAEIEAIPEDSTDTLPPDTTKQEGK
ncbi:hypothetical protein J7K18_02125 [bacterium]|nr:hypothetical protein [bacterium]